MSALFAGQADKATLVRLELLNLACLATCWILAQALFLGGGWQYSFLDDTISEQGSLWKNPTGFPLFTGSVVLASVLLVPLVTFLYRRYRETSRWGATLVLLAGLVGCTGFALVGLVPEEIKEPHELFATLAFGGLGGAAFFSFFLVLWSFRAARLPSPAGTRGPYSARVPRTGRILTWPRYTLLVYLVPFTIWILTGVVPNLPTAVQAAWPGDPRVFDWPLWQWSSFVGVLTWLCGSLACAPRLPQPGEHAQAPGQA